MFVYLLKHTEEPRFKIGKSNDIHGRIPGIGGIRTFNLSGSLCIQLPSDGDAYRVEKVLHRLFARWRLPVDKSNRYPGDTEQFNAECFDRVLKFLTDNPDLIEGALPMTIPSLPISCGPEVATGVSEESMQRRVKAKADARLARIEERHGETLKNLQIFVDHVKHGRMLCGIWSSKQKPGTQYLFRVVLGDDESSEFAARKLIETNIEPPGGGLVSIFGGGFFVGRFGYQSYYAEALDEWLNFASALPQIRDQIQGMTNILQHIPLIDDVGVFTLLRSAGLVDTVDKMGVNGLKEKIRLVMQDKHSFESSSIDNWILSYCAWGLRTFGIADDEIMIFLVTQKSKWA